MIQGTDKFSTERNPGLLYFFQRHLNSISIEINGIFLQWNLSTYVLIILVHVKVQKFQFIIYQNNILTIYLFEEKKTTQKLFKLSSVFSFPGIIESFTTLFISFKYRTKFLNIKYGSCPLIIAYWYNVKLEDLGSKQFNKNAGTCLPKHMLLYFLFPYKRFNLSFQLFTTQHSFKQGSLLVNAVVKLC